MIFLIQLQSSVCVEVEKTDRCVILGLRFCWAGKARRAGVEGQSIVRETNSHITRGIGWDTIGTEQRMFIF